MWIDCAKTFYIHFQNDIRDLNAATDSFRATLKVLKREGYRWTEDYLENTLNEVYKNRVHDFLKDLWSPRRVAGQDFGIPVDRARTTVPSREQARAHGQDRASVGASSQTVSEGQETLADSWTVGQRDMTTSSIKGQDVRGGSHFQVAHPQRYLDARRVERQRVIMSGVEQGLTGSLLEPLLESLGLYLEEEEALWREQLVDNAIEQGHPDEEIKRLVRMFDE
ncbi:hypothetical protein BGX23_012249 [Mortierella sp. AD031]|nr:hypothetical protein BGX23_012249 [Mortierella sp. AD031]